MSSISFTNNEVYLRRATRSDIPEMTRILWLNGLTFELKDHWAPTRRDHPEEFYSSILARIRSLFANPNIRILVAEKLDVGMATQHTRILGFACWNAEGAHNPILAEWRKADGAGTGVLSAFEQQLVKLEFTYYRYVRNRLVDYAALSRTIEKLHAGFADLPPHLHLQILMVDPDVHRSGVGARLLAYGKGVADATGLPLTLSSSRMGYPFYLRHALKLYTTVHVDTNPEYAFDMPLLIYEPKGKEGTWMRIGGDEAKAPSTSVA